MPRGSVTGRLSNATLMVAYPLPVPTQASRKHSRFWWFCAEMTAGLRHSRGAIALASSLAPDDELPAEHLGGAARAIRSTLPEPAARVPLGACRRGRAGPRSQRRPLEPDAAQGA